MIERIMIPTGCEARTGRGRDSGQPALPRGGSGGKLHRWLIVLVIAGLLAGSTRLEAERGDLLLTTAALDHKDLSDICRDSSDGTYWVTSATLGEIYHFSETLEHLPGDDLPSPHGSFNIISNPVLLRGIAQRESTGTLLTLALRRGVVGGQVSYEMHEMDTDGVVLTAEPVEIVTPGGEDVDYRGLTWDPLSGNIWTLDAITGDFVQFNLAGEFVKSLPQVNSGTCRTTFGKGVHFELHSNGATGFLHGAQGEVIDLGPSVILQHTLIATLSGAPLPLDQLPSEEIYGFVTSTFPDGDGELEAMVLIDDRSQLHVLDRGDTVSLVTVPPTGFDCFLDDDGMPHLTWTNHGNGADQGYIGQIHLYRNGQLLQSLPGSATSFLDESPIPGEVTYSLIVQAVLSSSPEISCTVDVGPGGWMSWHCFPGTSIFDLCRNPVGGEIYVTDPLGSVIHVLESDLTPRTDDQGEPVLLPSPFSNSERPGGIAFYSDGNGGAGSLMVTSLDRVVMREIALDGTPIDAGIPMSPPSGQNIGSSLTYNSQRQAFAYIDLGIDQLIHINRNGNPVPGLPPTHPALTGPFHRGLAYEPIQDRYFATFDQSSRVEQLFGTGSSSTQFGFSLGSLASGVQNPDVLGGVEVAGNTLLVCNREANVIHRLFLAALGGQFLRGDVDSSGQIEMVDAVRIAEYLFVEGEAPSCPDAADANDDGFIDVSDPVKLLYFLYLGGEPPPAPHPVEGTDPTFLDPLDCPL